MKKPHNALEIDIYNVSGVTCVAFLKNGGGGDVAFGHPNLPQKVGCYRVVAILGPYWPVVPT